MATAGALSGGGVALYGKRFSSLPTSLAGNRFHVATILSRPFDRVGQGFFYGRSLASAEVRSSTVMLGSRKLSIRNLFIRTESRAATQRISAEVSLRRRKAAIPIARASPPRSRLRPGQASTVPRWFHFDVIAGLGESSGVHVPTPVFPLTFRRNLAVR